MIGIVGFTPVLDIFPLSSALVEELRRKLPSDGSIAIENMSWGPIHIVQRFQDSEAIRPERVVLVGAASVSTKPGRVQAYRWLGGKLPINATQERVYEAVTGIVDIENTLAIGGADARVPFDDKVATALPPNAKFMRTRVVSGAAEDGRDS